MAQNKRMNGGPHKNHGPKRHLFKWVGTMEQEFSRLHLLNKYNNYESWRLAMTARGSKDISRIEFNRFLCMSQGEKRAYFKNVKR